VGGADGTAHTEQPASTHSGGTTEDRLTAPVRPNRTQLGPFQISILNELNSK
jgi:hypothetical protein